MSKNSRTPRRERAYQSPLALRAVHGHLTLTADRVIAWYLLAPQHWSWRSDSEREAVMVAQAAAFSRLLERRCHYRVTTRPYPVRRWAETLDANTQAPLPCWPDHLVREQSGPLGRSLADKLVFLGIELSIRRRGDRMVSAVWKGATAREAAHLDRQVAELDKVCAAAGLEARPASAREMEWLLHRSVSLGMPAPLTLGAVDDAMWETEDLAEFTDRVAWSADPYARTVKVVGERTGKQVTRHVAVLTVGRMGPLTVPQRDDPWMQRTDRLPFPVEWSATFDVKRGDSISREMQTQLARIRNQVAHFVDEHAQDPPPSLDRQRRRALAIDDEIATGFEGLATRVHGWFRIAVSGRTEEEALDRAQQVIDLYSPTITIVRPNAQYALAREFIPGEPLSSTAYRRRMPVTTLAAAFPAASAEVGDRRGVYLGYTCGATKRAVMWDPWFNTEVREGSGLVPIVAGLGGGKSTLMGLVAYKNVVRGTPWVLLDPSGPLARLCDLPEIRDVARHINLLNAEPGTLNPYRVIATPRREFFADEDDPGEAWERAKRMAEAQRRTLCIDMLRMLLPAQIEAQAETLKVLHDAARVIGGSETASPRQVIDQLRRHGSEHARTVADFLDDAAELPQAQLIFPAGYALDYDRNASRDHEYLLTVLSLRGLVMPNENVPRQDWTLEELYSVPLLHLAAWLTQRSIYDQPRGTRKGVGFDETHELARLSTGRVLLNKTARDTRKHNVCALMASQNAGDLLTADIANLVGAAFIGRTTDPEAQADALRLLKVPAEAEHAAALGALSAQDRRAEQRSGFREFVFADGSGGVEKIRVDLAYFPELQQALDTTANPVRLPAPLDGDTAEVLA